MASFNTELVHYQKWISAMFFLYLPLLSLQEVPWPSEQFLRVLEERRQVFNGI